MLGINSIESIDDLVTYLANLGDLFVCREEDEEKFYIRFDSIFGLQLDLYWSRVRGTKDKTVHQAFINHHEYKYLGTFLSKAKEAIKKQQDLLTIYKIIYETV